AARPPGPPADQPDDADAAAPRLDHRAHDFRDRELAGIGLLKPHAAGVEQDQHVMLEPARRSQQPGELGAMNFTESAAHEAPLLRGDEHRSTVQAAGADDDTVVELL